MTLDKINSQSLILFVSQHQKRINLAIVIVLSLYLIAFAAQTIWRIIPQPTLSANASKPITTSSSKRSSNNGVNIARLQQLNLFGEVDKQVEIAAPQEVTDAPETKLNLVLSGVVSSNTPKDGVAIIENRGKQATYGVGEKIDGTNAFLDQVQFDRVIIKNGVRFETLMLDGLDLKEANRQRQARVQNRPKVTQPRQNTGPTNTQRLSREAVEATSKLRSQPANFLEFISVSPHTADGQLVGYQVKPGKDKTLFQSAGLKNGDVVTQINGLDLTDPQQMREAMQELQNAQTLELTLTRDGEYNTIFLEMPEPEAD